MTGLECLGYKPRAKALQKQTKTSLAAFVEPRRNWEAPHSQLEPGSARHARTLERCPKRSANSTFGSSVRVDWMQGSNCDRSSFPVSGWLDHQSALESISTGLPSSALHFSTLEKKTATSWHAPCFPTFAGAPKTDIDELCAGWKRPTWTEKHFSTGCRIGPGP